MTPSDTMQRAVSLAYSGLGMASQIEIFSLLLNLVVLGLLGTMSWTEQSCSGVEVAVVRFSLEILESLDQEPAFQSRA
jgi:hypothetical protein